MMIRLFTWKQTEQKVNLQYKIYLCFFDFFVLGPKSKVLKYRDVQQETKADLDNMAKTSFETLQKINEAENKKSKDEDNCTAFDVLLELQSQKIELRIIKKLLLEALSF